MSWGDDDTPEGSLPMGLMVSYVRNVFKIHLNIPLPLKPYFGKDWRVTISGNSYPELWIRYYAHLRHVQKCTVIASDYANRITDSSLPIVRSLKLDLAILLEHARLLQQAKKKVRKRVLHGA